MSHRIYSEAFINKRIAQIDAMHDRGQNIPRYPRCMDTQDPSPFREQRLSRMDLEEIKAYIKWNRERAFVDGFWAGWTLREGCP